MDKFAAVLHNSLLIVKTRLLSVAFKLELSQRENSDLNPCSQKLPSPFVENVQLF